MKESIMLEEKYHEDKIFKMKIGILSKNYAAQRLFLDKLPECQYKDVRFYNWCLWKNAYLWGLKAIGKLKMSPE